MSSMLQIRKNRFAFRGFLMSSMLQIRKNRFRMPALPSKVADIMLCTWHRESVFPLWFSNGDVIDEFLGFLIFRWLPALAFCCFTLVTDGLPDIL
ncbi:hypothetical protein OIU77_009743 [Salix suchowensis]|uniref:Uncharacterized protein n=1 Tax=Salix suchowensis TaxID=1278906 RepID=A0ABQ9A5Y7_9ROSI|nr:hypothetical protein OIU77_009743 [Salix suchowensis]